MALEAEICIPDETCSKSEESHFFSPAFFGFKGTHVSLLWPDRSWGLRTDSSWWHWKLQICHFRFTSDIFELLWIYKRRSLSKWKDYAKEFIRTFLLKTTHSLCAGIRK